MRFTRSIPTLLVLLILTMTTAGCGLAAGIFKGGFIIGLIIAIVVIGLLVKLFSGRGRAP